MDFRTRRGRAKRAGQAMIFMIMIVVILVFVVLWNFDIHKILSVKFLSQNAGDSAALAASRWQATSLNIMGDLNIMHAVALADVLSGTGDPDAGDAISELQARLCYVGPMIGFMSAQQAAKNNRMHNNADFTDYLRHHVDKIRYDYPKFIVESYPGCLKEYANMLETVVNNGIAAGPDNMVLYSDYLGEHMLLNKDFYDAVATEDWCWFFFNAYDLLLTYADYHDWPPLPVITNPEPINPEFFSLHMSRHEGTIDAATVASMNAIKKERGLPGAPIDPELVKDVTAVWYGFDGQWSETFAMSDPSFPSAGVVKPQYDYVGADAAIRTLTTPDVRMPGAKEHPITWTAAAKPFGYLNHADKPSAYGLVLPAFHDVRLIPVDASSAPWGGSFDLAFRKHVEMHLPPYLAEGPGKLVPSCWYCKLILVWDGPEFRPKGIAWLAAHSALCLVPPPSGGGGGGTRRGH